nr:hypothetical protein CFP56_66810 [Quercus suber]
MCVDTRCTRDEPMNGPHMWTEYAQMIVYRRERYHQRNRRDFRRGGSEPRLPTTPKPTSRCANWRHKQNTLLISHIQSVSMDCTEPLAHRVASIMMFWGTSQGCQAQECVRQVQSVQSSLERATSLYNRGWGLGSKGDLLVERDL